MNTHDIIDSLKYNRQFFTKEEIRDAVLFALGFTELADKGEGVRPDDIDHWATVPTFPTLELHFLTNDNQTQVEVRLYRVVGGHTQTNQEIQLF